MNIAKITEEFLKENHSIRESLRKNIINYSSLARRIISKKKLDHKHFEAIVVAARRYQKKMHAPEEEDTTELLKKVEIEIRRQEDHTSIRITGKEQYLSAFMTNILSIFWENETRIPQLTVKDGAAEIILEQESLSKTLTALNL